MTTEKEEYRRRRAAQAAKYKNKFAERFLGWWRNPTDRFSFLIAIFTALLFLATIGLYFATRDLVADARENTKQQLRAYVAFSTSQPLSVSTSTVTFSIDNFGQTPGKDVHVWGNWTFVPFGQDLPDDFQFLVKPPCSEEGLPGQKIAPGPVTIFPRNPVPSHRYNCPNDAFDLKRAESQELNAFLYGFITYRDVFEDLHRTNFCLLWYPSTKTAFLCSRHNEIDPEVHNQ